MRADCNTAEVDADGAKKTTTSGSTWQPTRRLDEPQPSRPISLMHHVPYINMSDAAVIRCTQEVPPCLLMTDIMEGGRTSRMPKTQHVYHGSEDLFCPRMPIAAAACHR